MKTARAVEREVVILEIEGMTCASCVERIERVLSRHPAVAEARVSLASRTAAVRCSIPDPAPLIQAVEKAGYGARLHRPGAHAAATEARGYLRRLAVAAFCSFDVLVFSLVVSPTSRASMLAAWLFATPVQFYGGWPFLIAAARAARARTYTMDTLIACGSLAAYASSVAVALTGGRHAYFETSALIVTFLLLGRALEATARAKAGSASRLLLERRPRTARVLVGRRERAVAVDGLRVGDLVVVRPGENLPADGVVVRGGSSVDLSMLRGESVPVDVSPGDEVIGASLNVQGRLVVRLTAVGSETRLAQIVQLLETTQASKAPIQRLGDRVAGMIVPRLLVLAGGMFFFMALLGPGGTGDALLRAAAVLLVACPCSLGLATPVAIMAGSGRAAELGVLFKGGEVFEAARTIDTVLVDKTGTLTEGSMRLLDIVPVEGTTDELLALAAAAEGGSEHPFARCVVQAAEQRGLNVPEGTDHRAEAGTGITAAVEGSTVRVGRPRDLPASVAAQVDKLASRGLTVAAVWRDGRPVGLLAAMDWLKEGATDAIRRLRGLGLDVAVVSGDRRATVEAVAAEAGIDRIVAEVYPEGKVDEVRALQAAGKRVAFVGDGVNDAPALAQADLGVALGTGTDVAIEAGNVLIMGGDLRLVADSLRLARKTFWVIAQNLAWAFAYNSLMIPLAVVGKVSPLLASAVMTGSSVTVVANALRLRRFGATRREAPAPAIGAARPDETIAPSPQEATPAPAREAPASPTSGGETGPTAAAPRLPEIAREDAGKIVRTLERLFVRQWEV